MSYLRPSIELPPQPIKVGTKCWQIDVDRLKPPLDNGNWLDRLSEGLVTIAADHPDQQLYAASWVGPSVEFGYMGRSIWLALRGSRSLATELENVLRRLLPQQRVKNSLTDASQSGWVSELYIDQGHVWRPWDASAWSRVEFGKPNSASHEEATSGSKAAGDEGDGRPLDSAPQPSSPEVKLAKQALRYRAAKSDASVGTIQTTIEKLFKLPEGSVKLINPDRSFSKRNQSIRRLRERWEKS